MSANNSRGLKLKTLNVLIFDGVLFVIQSRMEVAYECRTE